MDTNCLFDLRILSLHWTFWRDSMIIGLFQQQNGERRHSLLWFTLGASTIIDKWPSVGQGFGRIVRIHIARILSSSYNYGTVQSSFFWEGGQRDDHRLRMCVNYVWSKLKEARISGFRTKLQSVEPWLKERNKIFLSNGRQENAFNGKQQGLAPNENVAVFYISVLREF